MRKSVIPISLVLIFLFPVYGHAQTTVYSFKEDANLSSEQNLKLKKLSDFLNKKGVCYIATIKVPTSSVAEAMFNNEDGYKKVLCIADFTSDAGKIDEKDGCGLAKYNARTDKYDVLMQANSSCYPQGLLDLQKMKASCVEPFKSDSIFKCMYFRPKSHWKIVLLRGAAKGYTEWFKHYLPKWEKENPDLVPHDEEKTKVAKAEPKKNLSMHEQADLHDAQRNVCVGWLVEHKFPADSWQYKSSQLKKALEVYKEKYGNGDIKSLVETVCKPVVKEQICNSHAGGKVHNEGVIPGYFIYGYPDLNVLFKKYKNSMEVATQLCGKKTDFHYPSVNQMEDYETGTK